jgi:large repetitive protein
LSADTGSSATDFVTNVATQTITGTLSGPLGAGDIVQVSLDNGTTWLNATAAAGTMTFSLAGATLAGSNTLVARVENSAGAFSPTFSDAYVLDQVPPSETTSIVAMTDDSGAAGDFITNNGAAGRTVSGTLSTALAADEILNVSSDGGVTWALATVSGATWSVTDSASHSANWTIEAQVVDLAGNIGAIASKAVTFDNTAPAAPSTLDLAATSDSGVSQTDNLTNVTTPVFTGTAEAGSTVTLFDGTTAVGTGFADATGVWSITTASALANGVQSISATATDAAGNVSLASGLLSVTIDTVAPAVSAPDLIATSDSGRSSTDNITNVTSPSFKGTAEAGSTVVLLDGTAVIGSGIATATGTWTIIASTLTDGIHNIAAKATDAAGNSATSAALAVTIDTVVAQPSTPDMTAATDRGASNTDNITNDNTPTFTGTAEAGSTVTLFDGATVIGTSRATTAGIYTITASTLTDGSHSMTSQAVDVAGNVSSLSGALTVSIDTVVPAAPSAPDLTAASDSGVSNTDNITNDTTPTFTGTAEAGSAVSIYNSTSKVGTGIAGADGSWTITTAGMGNGIHIMTAKATDVAGNVSLASAALSITIDATAPARPTLPDLIASSDSGVSSTDNITNVVTPTFAGTAEAASTVTIYDGTTALGTTVATALGNWTTTVPTLANGTHSITVKATDAASNVSAASPALSVTIDTVAPNAPAFAGGSATTLRGTGEVGATVSIIDGTTPVGTAAVGSGGNWSWSFLASASVRFLTAVQTDKAGNTSPVSNGVALIGTSGADQLASTAGNDVLIGGAGADTFSFAASFGRDVIADFAAGGTAHDIINFHGSSVLNSFASVIADTTQTATGVVISDGSNTLILNNVTKTNLTAADFAFV